MFEVAFDAPNQAKLLPNEPARYCAGDLQGRVFVRLSLSVSISSGFEVHLHDLLNQTSTILPPRRSSGFTHAGDMMISPDERVARYALAQVEKFGSESKRCGLPTCWWMLAQTQTILMPPSAVRFRPLHGRKITPACYSMIPNKTAHGNCA
ncbi:MAG UNVERIFIED_CONTAM: hypothetical protein LVT10_13930 [Anaerolineae bacterium]